MDQFLIGIVTVIGGEIAKYAIAPIGRQLGYLIYYRRNVDNLSSQVESLEEKKTIIDRRVEEARRKGEETEGYIITWLSQMEKRSGEAKNIVNDEGHCKAKCSCGWSFPRLTLRHHLSRKAKKMAETIVREIAKAEKFDSISYTPALESAFANKRFEAFETRVVTSKDIMEALKDPDLGMIGVYGMGGVGKTMLVKDIARKVREQELFNEVVMVTVTQSVDLISIQQEIAEKLGFYLFDKTISARAERLHHRLSQENKLLIILDDIWEELKLEDAGIYYKDGQKGCKLLLISRDRYVLRNLMGVEKDFLINVLSNKEAMKLFNKYVGDAINERDEFKSLATALVGECGGLPIAIETIACTLRKRPICVWEDALQLVKRSPRQGYGKAYSSIKTSFDFLENEEKSILLLCSLHKEDANISVENLMHIYIASCDLLQEMDTLDEARNRINTLLDRLKAHCLLHDGDHHDTIKMHDTIRDIVMSIALEDKNMFCLKNVSNLEGFLNKGKIRDSTAISVLDRDLNSLPNDLACPKLELLVIFDKDQDKMSLKRYNHRPMMIPNECFIEAKKLRALCLDSAILESLPSSFCSLQNLQTLSLQGCTLEDIAMIGELQNLTVLNLLKCNFKQLPKQIGKLTRLRLLNLMGCKNLRVVEPNVFSSLVQLEELYMNNVLISWGDVCGKGRNASLIELKNLPKLRALYLAIEDSSLIPEGMFSEKLERYNMVIGRFFKRRPIKIPSSRLLQLEECGNLFYEDSFQRLLKMSEVLSLGKLRDVKNLVHQLDADGFPHLKILLIEDSGGIRHIVESTEQIKPFTPFQNLETLSLIYMNNLEDICYGKYTIAPFGQLRRVRISSCAKLKNVFSVSSAVRLEEISVFHCNMIEEIFYQEVEDENTMKNKETDNNIVAFPHLRSLELTLLPKLIQFLKMSRCYSPSNSTKPFFNQKVVFPNLNVLKLHGIMNFSELWQSELPTTSFMKNITKLVIYRCEELKYLLSTTVMSRSLIQLEYLEISYCPLMEDVVIINEPRNKGRSENILFPRLRNMKFESLPSLKRFTTLRTATSIDQIFDQTFLNGKLAFPCLENLTVDKCESLKYLLSHEAARSLLRLQFLTIKSCQNMEEVIVTKELSEVSRLEKISFSKLESLQFSSLLNLKRFCTADCVEFPSLLKLDIYNCPELPIATFNKEVAFPNLKLLQLSEMGFRNLRKLIVLDCNNLDYLFPSAMVGSLSLLKELHVHGCKSMKEVVIFPEELIQNGCVKKISFPKLEILELRNLQSLNRFCEAEFFECPFLLNLEIQDCPELRTFITNSTSRPLDVEPEQIEEVDLVGEKLPLFNEKVLQLAQTLLTLTKLVVINCGRLKTLVTTSSVSFQNLEDLQVSKCHGMINLLGSSTAKSLVQLTRLKIIECEQLKQVIATEEVDDSTESTDLVFSHLESLVLYCLPQLRSFYDGDCNIQFPHMKKVIASECPEMKSFCGGTAITSKLDKVIAKVHCYKTKQDPEFAYPAEEHWEGDLNSSIARLWEKNDSSTALKSLFSETVQSDKSFGSHKATHKSVQIVEENTASTSK